MNAHALLNLLNELGESDKMRDLLSILLFFCNELYRSTSVRLNLSHDININLKSHFSQENIKCLPSLRQRFNRRHYVALRICWFIDFFAWCFITPNHDVM